MANPAIIDLVGKKWNLVKASVSSGVIHKLTVTKMLQTYRNTGGDAPTDTLEGVIFNNCLKISSSVLIDVYIYPDKDSQIRIDL